MTSKSGGDWRDKYLDALDEQERLQKTFEQQQELFRRALVRVSLAAEGHDDSLDQDLQRLRTAVKADSGELEPVMEGLESSLLSYERRKESEAKVDSDSFLAMIESLQDQTEDRGINKSLKGFAKAIKKGEAGSLTEQLKQFKWLQQQVLQSIDVGEDKSRPGFMDRLLGRSSGDDTSGQQPSSEEIEGAKSDSADEEAKSSAAEAAVEQTDLEPEEVVVSAPISAESSTADDEELVISTEPESTRDNPLEGQLQTKAEAQLADEKDAQFQRPVNEPAFSRVSDKVARVLNDLLDKVEPVDCTEQKAADARERIDRGLNWYELVPTLEDIRDLVLHAYLLADEQYREYLRQIHQVLATIVASLGVSIESHQQWVEADESFDQALTQQLGSLGQSVAVATEVDALKADVNEHLRIIQDALSQKQSHTADSKLGEQLAQLVAQVKQVEQEAATAKAELETQKIKAATDGLTGLPNREAYNERGFHEWNRWKRYGHPLTLVVCDIDHFKKINDTYGHQAGDRVLQVLSKAISKRLREVDFMARYGGEEFVILLPETPQAKGFEVMDKIRSVIASTPFRFKQVPVQVTFSMGVVGLKEGDTLEKAFAKADELLYKAKQAGRNCCMQDDRPATDGPDSE